MKYAAATLVGKHKLYAMPLFFEYLGKLNILPQEIWISCTEEIYQECMKSYNLDIPVKWLHGEDDLGNDMIHSTTAARNAIREAHLASDYEWVLWLDNDMLVPPNMVDKFLDYLEADPKLQWVHSFHPYRLGDGTSLRHGLGSCFIHRDLMDCPFIHIKLRGPDGRLHNLGDDYLWKVIIAQFQGYNWIKGKSGVLFKVDHLRKSGEIIELSGEQLSKIPRTKSDIET